MPTDCATDIHTVMVPDLCKEVSHYIYILDSDDVSSEEAQGRSQLICHEIAALCAAITQALVCCTSQVWGQRYRTGSHGWGLS